MILLTGKEKDRLLCKLWKGYAAYQETQGYHLAGEPVFLDDVASELYGAYRGAVNADTADSIRRDLRTATPVTRARICRKYAPQHEED